MASAVIGALGALKGGINTDKSVIELVESSINFFNSISGFSKDIWDKVRPLEITIVNLSLTRRLQMDKEWFDSGRLWSYPAQTIQPGCSLTFYACNRDGSFMTGVSFKVLQKKGKEDSQLVCTFSNPWFGCIKGHCSDDQTDIEKVWDGMYDSNIIREPLYGFYRKGDRSLVFIWKDKKVQW